MTLAEDMHCVAAGVSLHIGTTNNIDAYKFSAVWLCHLLSFVCEDMLVCCRSRLPCPPILYILTCVAPLGRGKHGATLLVPHRECVL